MKDCNINIQNESTEFIRLQALGHCNQSCKKRLTKLSQKIKNLAFIEVALNSFKGKVYQCEQDLIDYIWMVVHGTRDNVAKQRLERHYNSLISNTY